jgi:hypothetical protein
VRRRIIVVASAAVVVTGRSRATRGGRTGHASITEDAGNTREGAAGRSALKCRRRHERYPSDHAVGFRTGEIRGWLWVGVPKLKRPDFRVS